MHSVTSCKNIFCFGYFCCLFLNFHCPQRGPFSHPGRSMLKTITMAVGEYEFDAIFRQDPTGGFEAEEEIPFPTISIIVWVAFIILMPILLTNMLVCHVNVSSVSLPALHLNISSRLVWLLATLKQSKMKQL